MKSYWFVYYAVYYTNKENCVTTIKGNSVHELDSDTFLPFAVRNIIEESYLKETESKCHADSDVCVTIESFGEITLEGYNNFVNERKIPHKFGLTGREFTISKSSTVTIIQG